MLLVCTLLPLLLYVYAAAAPLLFSTPLHLLLSCCLPPAISNVNCPEHFLLFFQDLSAPKMFLCNHNVDGIMGGPAVANASCTQLLCR